MLKRVQHDKKDCFAALPMTFYFLYYSISLPHFNDPV